MKNENLKRRFNRELIEWCDAAFARIQKGEFNKLWKAAGTVLAETDVDIGIAEAAETLAYDVYRRGRFKTVGNIMLMTHEQITGRMKSVDVACNYWKYEFGHAMTNLVFGQNTLHFVFQNEWEGRKPRRVSKYTHVTGRYHLNAPGSLGYGAHDIRCPVKYKSAEKIWRELVKMG